MQGDMSRTLQERDQFRNDLGDIYKSKKQVERQYDHDKKMSKERETKLQKSLAECSK